MDLRSRFVSLFRPLRLFLVLALLTPGAALAADAKLGALEIHHPWARPTTGSTGAAYFTITNTGTADDALLRAEAAVAPKVQIHTMTMDGMVMRMRELDRLALPAGQTVAAAPGGIHIMLIGLKAPLVRGDTFSMTLVFEKAGSVDVTVDVQTPEEARKSQSGASDMPGMKDMH